ncbi:hypothetical protein BT63DRAFT_477447 [Microthyrium microscopicum]|uniref:Uncharacterized protein n=1 Tax=Microthyrium microscopicum TaxID=703497 RepID=A0A6A6UGC0_9PEZI|nr:hypothetical protein BT63DRAFT_477447 [Microthyrium microscopicum]
MASSSIANLDPARQFCYNLNRLPLEVRELIVLECFPTYRRSDGISRNVFEASVTAAFNMVMSTKSLFEAFELARTKIAEAFHTYEQARMNVGTYFFITSVTAFASTEGPMESSKSVPTGTAAVALMRLEGYHRVYYSREPLLENDNQGSLALMRLLDLSMDTFKVAMAITRLLDNAPDLSAELGQIVPQSHRYLATPKADRDTIIINRITRVLHHIQLFVAIKRWLPKDTDDDVIQSGVEAVMRRSHRYQGLLEVSHTLCLMRFLQSLSLEANTFGNTNNPSVSRLLKIISESEIVGQILQRTLDAVPISAPVGQSSNAYLPDLPESVDYTSANIATRMRKDSSMYIHNFVGSRLKYFSAEFYNLGTAFCGACNEDGPNYHQRRQLHIHDYYHPLDSNGDVKASAQLRPLRSPRRFGENLQPLLQVTFDAMHMLEWWGTGEVHSVKRPYFIKKARRDYCSSMRYAEQCQPLRPRREDCSQALNTIYDAEKKEYRLTQKSLNWESTDGGGWNRRNIIAESWDEVKVRWITEELYELVCPDEDTTQPGTDIRTLEFAHVFAVEASDDDEDSQSGNTGDDYVDYGEYWVPDYGAWADDDAYEDWANPWGAWGSDSDDDINGAGFPVWGGRGRGQFRASFRGRGQALGQGGGGRGGQGAPRRGQPDANGW